MPGRRNLRERAAALTLAVLAALTGACGGAASRPGSSGGLSGTLQVLAAASLTEAFRQVGADFEKRHPGLHVEFDFAGSPTLVTQIEQGAPADVFASADQPNMKRVQDAGLTAGAAHVFVRNRLQVVVQAGNPKHIRGLADLARPGLAVVLASPAVPAGRYGREALAKAGVKVTPRSLEDDVKAVLAKVALGEADAGIVYATDVRAGGPKVSGVDIPADQNVVAAYPVAQVRGAKDPAAARAFVDYLLEPAGQRTMTRFGFTPA